MDIELARAIPFLKSLTVDELEPIVALMTGRACEKDERIMEQGTVPVELFVVRNGVVHVRRRAKIREMYLASIGPGGVFGEINLFDPGKTTASIYAKTKVELIVIPYGSFRAYMEEHPRAGYQIASSICMEMANRLRVLGDRFVNVVFPSDGTEDKPSV